MYPLIVPFAPYPVSNICEIKKLFWGKKRVFLFLFDCNLTLTVTIQMKELDELITLKSLNV